MTRTDKIMGIIFPMVILSLVIIYYFVNPHVTSFPIKCVWKVLTGTDCPACGAQRALHALSHGNFTEALSYNYFFILSVPYAFLAILVSWYNYNDVFGKLKEIVFHRYTLKVYVYLYFGWWIMRNVLSI